ncbi:MAG TPA: ChaN family lipoprotein [Myxococcales bacterium]|nr:ChaN family lipoprotein [Myxococcales bacterium]
MRASLSLHLALFRRQRARIARAVEGTSSAFRAYERRYRDRIRRFSRPLTFAQVRDRALEADVVYVGDYHTLRIAQQSYRALVEAALGSGRRVVLALELVEGRFQEVVDRYLRGRLSERRFLDAIGHGGRGPFDLWAGFKPILELARARGLEVIAIDRRARGPRSLQLRDRYAGRRIAAAAAAPDRPLVMVLVGQFHAAPCHLPREVRRALGPRVERRQLVAYQNCEPIYWALARRGEIGRVEAVELRPGEVCLVNASPVVCQQSFLDYVEAESGDEPLHERAAQERFAELAEMIGRLVGVDVRRGLSHVEVATFADLGFFERLRRRGGFGAREMAELRAHVLSRESCYVPRARTVYLASLSLNHAAEEAAHFVRHCAVGAAMEHPRIGRAAFYARCVEEAIGFFGSKLVNPHRRCAGLDDWGRTFTRDRGELRQVAAFVLAHAASERDGRTPFVPARAGRVFIAASHALGYLLGEALYRALDEGRFTRAEVKALFREPAADPEAAYFRLLHRARGTASRQPGGEHRVLDEEADPLRGLGAGQAVR